MGLTSSFRTSGRGFSMTGGRFSIGFVGVKSILNEGSEGIGMSLTDTYRMTYPLIACKAGLQ